MRDPERIGLFHHNGGQWSGTRAEFKQEFGAQLFFQHNEGHVAGWYRLREHAEAHGELRARALGAALAGRGDISGPNNPNADPMLYQFVVLATGERIDATKMQIRERFGIKASAICSLFSGRQQKTHGVALAGVAG